MKQDADPEARRSLTGFQAQMNTSDSWPRSTMALLWGISTSRSTSIISPWWSAPTHRVYCSSPSIQWSIKRHPTGNSETGIMEQAGYGHLALWWLQKCVDRGNQTQYSRLGVDHEQLQTLPCPYKLWCKQTCVWSIVILTIINSKVGKHDSLLNKVHSLKCCLYIMIRLR